jgi:hypothetical protein
MQLQPSQSHLRDRVIDLFVGHVPSQRKRWLHLDQAVR